MKVYRLTPDPLGVVEWPHLSASRGSTITIGTFDGMHRGHQALIHRVIDLARSYNTRSVAIIFDPRPQFVFDYRATHQKKDPPADVIDPDQLVPIDERLKLMEQAGIDVAIVVRFTTPFAQTSYSSFLGQLISQRVENSHNPVHTLGLHTLVLGQDARLGRDGKGTAQTIARIAEAFRFFQVDIVDDKGPGFMHIPAGVLKGVPVEKKVRVWSSSAMRSFVKSGDVDKVADISGRPYAVWGTVVHGDGSATDLGFPTANIGEVKNLIPADGVYEGWMSDDSATYPVAISVGTKPTFTDDGQRVVEAHVVGVAVAAYSKKPGSASSASSAGASSSKSAPKSSSQSSSQSSTAPSHLDLYGDAVRVDFVRKIGDQQKFASADEFVTAIGEWVDQTRDDLL